MKKILMTFVMVLSSVFCFAQKIEKDWFSDNIHHILTEWEEVEDNIDKRDFYVRLQVSQNDSIRIYSVLFQPYSYSDFSFSEGSKLLVKTMSDDVLTLTCTFTYPTLYQTVQIFFVPTIRYYSTVGYDVTEDELNKMITGIKKLRFEVTAEGFQYEYKKDKIGKYLKKAKENIDKALAKTKKFEDDF